MRDLLDVLHAGLISSGERQDVYVTARALLCSRHEDWPRFDLIFRQFWGRTRQIIIPSDTAAPRPETQSQAGPDTPRASDEMGATLPVMERTVAFDAAGEPAGEPSADPARLERVRLYSARER